jgi:uncharacterized protein
MLLAALMQAWEGRNWCSEWRTESGVHYSGQQCRSVVAHRCSPFFVGLVSMLRMPSSQIFGHGPAGAHDGLSRGVPGLGGGVIQVPALLYFMGYNQHLAQGTTLALLCLPVGIAAATTYYRQGLVRSNLALLLSKCALAMPQTRLLRGFGLCLPAVGARVVPAR